MASVARHPISETIIPPIPSDKIGTIVWNAVTDDKALAASSGACKSLAIMRPIVINDAALKPCTARAMIRIFALGAK